MEHIRAHCGVKFLRFRAKGSFSCLQAIILKGTLYATSLQMKPLVKPSVIMFFYGSPLYVTFSGNFSEWDSYSNRYAIMQKHTFTLQTRPLAPFLAKIQNREG